MDFRPMSAVKLQELSDALRSNVDQGTALLMDRCTSFTGVGVVETDDSWLSPGTINAIASVPTHY